MTSKTVRFCRALVTAVRATFELNRANCIRFNDGGDYLYANLSLKLFFGRGGDDIVSVELTLAQAKKLFEAIEIACDHRDIQTISLDDWSLTVDAKGKPSDPDFVAIKYRRLSESVNTVSTRERMKAAANEFKRRFDLV